MTLQEKQETVEKLRASAKDAQAELGYIALQREAQDTRWEELKKALVAGEQEYRRVSELTVDEAPAE